MIELTIWEHPAEGQPFAREMVLSVPVERVGELIAIAQERGFEYCTEVLGRYLFVHSGSTDTACVAVSS